MWCPLGLGSLGSLSGVAWVECSLTSGGQVGRVIAIPSSLALVALVEVSAGCDVVGAPGVEGLVLVRVGVVGPACVLALFGLWVGPYCGL